MTMFESFDRKKALSEIDSLINKNYGSYLELVQLTAQEITDINKVMESKKQEETLAGALKNTI